MSDNTTTPDLDTLAQQVRTERAAREQAEQERDEAVALLRLVLTGAAVNTEMTPLSIRKAPGRPQGPQTEPGPTHGMPTLHPVVCPACGAEYHSVRPIDTTVPTFYTGRPWVCPPCRQERPV